MKKLAVIVPCYNEEAVIEESYRRTKEVLVKLPNPTEIIYINDGSQDKTRSLLDHIADRSSCEGDSLLPEFRSSTGGNGGYQ